MKKNIKILIAFMLVISFVLTACGKSEPTEEAVTINLPEVVIADDVAKQPETYPFEEAPEEPTTIESVENAYPIEQAPAEIVFDPALAYPIDPASPNYETEMEDYVTLLIGEAHDLQFLLEKDLTAEQWREILTNANHTHLQLSEGAMQTIIDWLISK